MAKFGAGDPYGQKPLERKEIIEASHKAAIQMAEMLGQDANVHAEGAETGQHASFPLPKAQQGLSQPIKLFLSNRKTPAPEDFDKGQDDGDDIRNMYGVVDNEYMDISPSYGEEAEELITEILERRLAYLSMAFQPPEPVEGPADILFIVRRSKNSGQRVLIRAHSQVLKRTNDAFNELIGYKPSMALQEEKETPLQVSWKSEDVHVPHRHSIYTNLIANAEKERGDKYSQAISQYQEKQGEKDNKIKVLEDKLESNFVDAFQNLGNGEGERNMMFGENDFMKEKYSNGIELKNSQNNIRKKFIGDLQHKKIEAQGLTKMNQDQQNPQTQRLDMGLESVIGNLQDSMKPSLINQFLDASLNLVQLPGRDHLPTDLKQSFEQFAASVNRFKYPDFKQLREATHAQTEVDGKSLESELLGMVGMGSNNMLSIMNNVGQKLAERRASRILIEKAKLEDLEGKPGNEVSAKVSRTRLERKKSQAYVENQERRASILPSNRLNNVPLILNQDKRISPSFLERRQCKILIELSKKEEETSNAEEITLQRRSSKAALAAFERRKRFSTLENKRTEELEFGLPSRESIIMFGNRRDSKARRVSDATCLQRQFAIARKSVQSEPKKTRAKMVSISEPLTLSCRRDEDKDDVLQLHEEEAKDIYETSSSSSSELDPPCLPQDVEFLIEKMHWTFDILCALMEFIYTENLHASCVELPDVYKAANEILLSSLTDAIRLKPITQYYRLAMVNDENRISLLDLANQLTTIEDFENYVNKNEDFVDLKKLCEAFELDGPLERRPYTLLLETGHVAFGNIPYVTQGLHTIEGQMVLILKDPREGTKLFEQNLEQNEYLTFGKRFTDQRNGKPFTKMLWLGQWPPIEKTRNREKAWKIYFFNFKDLQRDIPLRNYMFYNHLRSLTLRPTGKEEFNLRIVCGLLICPVLFKALQLSFPQLDIVVGRGAGYFLGGETHGNNITLTGRPLYLLRACKSLPRHLIGRTVLRVANPCEKTFVRLWMSTNRFGVDLECGVMYFLKPLIQIQKMLEYWHDLDMDANYVVTHPREMVELVEPHDPF